MTALRAPHCFDATALVQVPPARLLCYKYLRQRRSAANTPRLTALLQVPPAPPLCCEHPPSDCSAANTRSTTALLQALSAGLLCCELSRHDRSDARTPGTTALSQLVPAQPPARLTHRHHHWGLPSASARKGAESNCRSSGSGPPLSTTRPRTAFAATLHYCEFTREAVGLRGLRPTLAAAASQPPQLNSSEPHGENIQTTTPISARRATRLRRKSGNPSRIEL